MDGRSRTPPPPATPPAEDDTLPTEPPPACHEVDEFAPTSHGFSLSPASYHDEATATTMEALPCSIVPPEWVARHGHGDVRVLDVRDKDEDADALGQILGARRVSPAELVSEARSWRENTAVVLICRTGARSARIADKLRNQGLRGVVAMEGGMVEWNKRGMPVRLSARAVRGDVEEPMETGVHDALEAPE